MQNRFFRLPTTARNTLVLVAILLLSTLGMMGAQDLGKAKDVIIDEPADKVEDVFDTDDDVEVEIDRDEVEIETDDSDIELEVDQEIDSNDLEGLDDVEYDVEDLDQDGDDILIEKQERYIIREKPSTSTPCEPCDQVDTDLDDVDDDTDLDDVEDDVEDLDEDGDDILIERAMPQPTREKPSSTPNQDSQCRQTLTPALTGLVVSIQELRDNQEDYFGKTVTVHGEMHRTFTDNVFTIEDDGFFKDHDLLVISTSPKEEVVVPLGDSIEDGKDVRVTGVVQPYDRAKLECAYGPLNLESREGHSFTHGPVIIIDTRKTAMLEPPALEPPMAALPPPEPLPEPAPAWEPTEEIAVFELPAELPRTSSGLPILGLAGLLGLSAALAARRYALKGRDE